jgi:hypothetical protein
VPNTQSRRSVLAVKFSLGSDIFVYYVDQLTVKEVRVLDMCTVY